MEIQVQQDVAAATDIVDRAYQGGKVSAGPRPNRGGEWSESAVRVLRERYLRKRDGQVVETPDEMCWRVAGSVAEAEAHWGSSRTVEQYAQAFYDTLIERKFMPNSPTLMNAGTGNGLQYSACYVLPVGDSIPDIFDTLKNAAIIHQSGGGTGFAFSRVRRKNSLVSRSGGRASGPVSFLRVFNAATEAVKQGGTRRGANMGILRVDHPDVLEFIECKNDGGITNFNISVAITDPFMDALRRDDFYDLVDPHSREVTTRLRARDVWAKIIDSAWRSGDPGLVFIDRINSSPANPTPEIGMIEATNPCVVGSTRLATAQGLLRMDALFAAQESVRVAVDPRATGAAQLAVNGATISRSTGVQFHDAVPVFRTGQSMPVWRLTTSHGMIITATPNHRFLTSDGYRRLDQLEYGDTVLLQSAEGGWSTVHDLPAVTYGSQSDARLRAREARGEAEPPTAWSEELGETLGYLLGDGWVRRDTTSDVLGLAVALIDRPVAEALQARMSRWFGAPGHLATRQGHLQITYKGAPATFFTQLGLQACRAPEKRVPECIFSAPREAVVGFLRGLFSADGTVNINERRKTCSVRLASSSLELARDVQQLLLNFGIVSAVRLRRHATVQLLPNAQREPAEYATAAQYEVLLDKVNRDRFVEMVGFMQERQQTRARAWIDAKSRATNSETFETRVALIEDAGRADVYDTTEPVTHSIIVNGLVTHQCGEQPLLPNEACNLGSLNVARFLVERDGVKEIDWGEMERVAKLSVRFLDDVIEANPYPLPEIDAMVKANRRIGLGIMGWADLLFELGIPYDSDEAIQLADRLWSFIERAGHQQSQELARERGPFPNWERSIYRHGPQLRNSTVTTIAPTGTISIIADASSGIEPIFALAFQHKVDDRVLTFTNPIFAQAAQRRGIHSDELMSRVSSHGSVHGVDGVPEDLQRVFVTAHEVEPEWHVRMQAAFQKHTDNGVSKTINLPASATVAEVENAYDMAWNLGCMGITVFRDGCKGAQVLNIGVEAKQADTTEAVVEERAAQASLPGLPTIQPRPRKVIGETHKIATPVGTAYVTVNMDERGEPLEAFVNIGSSGSDITAFAEAIGRLISLVLRTPSPLTQREKIGQIVDQLSGIGGSRSLGFGAQRVLSLPDGLAQVLDEYTEKLTDQIQRTGLLPELSMKADLCPSCGWAAFVHEEGCKKCHMCGHSEC